MQKFLLFFTLGCLYTITALALDSNSTTSVSAPKTLTGIRLNETNRNALYVEILGRGGLYSLGYEYATSKRASIGIGFSYQGMQMKPIAGEGKLEIQTFPVYSNLFFPMDAHRPFISAGVTFMNIKSEANLNLNTVLNKFSFQGTQTDGSSVEGSASVGLPELNNSATITIALPSVGVGYEYRMRSGAFSRLQSLAMLFDKLYVWAGFSIGVGF